MEANILVGDAMTTSPVTCTGDLTLSEVAKIMSEQKVGSVLVVKEKRVIGIITESDFVKKVLAKDVDPKEAKVIDYMTKELVTVTPSIDIIKAMNIMRKNDMRRLPVVEDTSLKGMLTAKDILKIQPQLFELMHEMYEIREAHRKPIPDEYPMGQYEQVMNDEWEED